MDSSKLDPVLVGGRRLIRCDVCGYTRECGSDEFLRYARGKWPKCCGAVVSLFAEVAKPGPDDTAHDLPPIPVRVSGPGEPAT